MKPWKALGLIVPAGLLLGMAAGAANRPVMVERAHDLWPASVAERQTRVDAPRPFYEAGPENLTPAAFSYRPDLDFAASAWPDQDMVDATLYETRSLTDDAQPAAPMPTVRRASAELAGDRAQDAADAAMAALEAAPAAEGSEVADAAIPQAPAPVAPIETGSF